MSRLTNIGERNIRRYWNGSSWRLMVQVGANGKSKRPTFPDTEQGMEDALDARDRLLRGAAVEPATRQPTTRGYTPDIALDGTMDETDADEGQDRQGSKATGAHGRYRQYLYDLGWRNIDVKVTYDKRDLLGSAAVIAMETPHGEPRTIIASAVEVPVKVVDYAWNTLGVNILHLRWKDEA